MRRGMGNLFSCCWCVRRDGPVNHDDDRMYLCGSMRFDCTGRETAERAGRGTARQGRGEETPGGYCGAWRDGERGPRWWHREKRVNIVLAGSSGAGKTLLSSAMASAAHCPNGAPQGRQGGHEGKERACTSRPSHSAAQITDTDTGYVPTIGVDVHVLSPRCTVCPQAFAGHWDRPEAPDLPYSRELALRTAAALGAAAPQILHVADCAQRTFSDDSDWDSSESDDVDAPSRTEEGPSSARAATSARCFSEPEQEKKDTAHPALAAQPGLAVRRGWWRSRCPGRTETPSAPPHRQFECPAMIWDTAGGSRFVNVILPYVRTADVVVLVYDAGDVMSARALRDVWGPAVVQMQGDRSALAACAAARRSRPPVVAAAHGRAASASSNASGRGHVVIVRNSCAAHGPESSTFRAWHSGAAVSSRSRGFVGRHAAVAHAGSDDSSTVEEIAAQVRDDVVAADRIVAQVAARMFAGAPIVCVDICPPVPGSARQPSHRHLVEAAGCLLRALCLDVLATRAWATRGGGAQYSN